jgi:ectoine hydroxylase-related dioxygenase (phytanoyl-CoA dioxygenase family)
MRNELDIVMFDVQPGDCVAFNAKTIHGATGNSDSRRRAAYSVRWAGNDVVYFPRPTSSPPYRDPGLSSGQALESDVFPIVFTRLSDRLTRPPPSAR